MASIPMVASVSDECCLECYTEPEFDRIDQQQQAVATGLSAGTVTVNATDPATSISGSATLNVTAATLTGIVVSPVGQTIAPLSQLFFNALGEFSDNTTQDITQDVNWSSTAPAVATIDTTRNRVLPPESPQAQP